MIVRVLLAPSTSRCRAADASQVRGSVREAIHQSGIVTSAPRAAVSSGAGDRRRTDPLWRIPGRMFPTGSSCPIPGAPIERRDELLHVSRSTATRVGQLVDTL